MPNQAQQTGKLARVFIVNDDRAIRQTLGIFLQDEGFTVEMAVDGRQAIEVLRHSAHPRVMLLDDLMPVANGFEVLVALSAEPVLAGRTACVYLTARAILPPELAQRLEESKIPVLLYPFELESLLRAVTEAATQLGHL